MWSSDNGTTGERTTWCSKTCNASHEGHRDERHGSCGRDENVGVRNGGRDFCVVARDWRDHGHDFHGSRLVCPRWVVSDWSCGGCCEPSVAVQIDGLD